ncbi:MAG: anthrone oxygenase family protein [Hyphomicrobiales bacterium]
MPLKISAMMSLSLLLCAAIFGFFYAWVCSTMWGLDAADPRIAIAAMQAMNGSVRNAVFAPAFFGTPLVLAITAWLLWAHNHKTSAKLFALSAAVYLGFGLILTMVVNVPMNEALALVTVPQDIDAARTIWQNYSKPWQVWNQIRTVASGLAFLLPVIGTLKLSGRPS